MHFAGVCVEIHADEMDMRKHLHQAYDLTSRHVAGVVVRSNVEYRGIFELLFPCPICLQQDIVVVFISDVQQHSMRCYSQQFELC